MNILKFNISSNFAYFQDKVNLRNNISYPCIHKPAILGLLGAILGLDGFSKIKKNGEIKYISELSSIKVGIKIKSDIQFTTVKTNDSTGLDVTNIKNRTIQKTEAILNHPDYDIYLKIDDLKLYELIYDRLINKKYFYEPSLGKSYFFANINNLEIKKISPILDLDFGEDDIIYIESIFLDEDKLKGFEEGYESDLFEEKDMGFKFVLPINSDKLTGQYIDYKLFNFNHFLPKENITEDYLNIDNELIYFI